MGKLVGSFAAVHGPLMVRNWDAADAGARDQVGRAFAELGARIRAVAPDVLVVASPDHWVNFFIDNYPSVCIGVGATHQGPPEPWMGAFPFKEMAGHAPFAMHLAQTALDTGFEPSLSHRLALDHGFCIPIWKTGLTSLPALVPVVLNTIEPPMPSFARCYEWGGLIARAVASYPDDLRVAVLGTGGLSHSIGEPTMGRIDEQFDRTCLDHLASGNVTGLLRHLDGSAAKAGNGAAEMRDWLVAHGAAGGHGFELIHYQAIPQWYIGAGIAAWRVNTN